MPKRIIKNGTGKERFIRCYKGNIKKAAKKAGISYQYGRRLATQSNIREKNKKILKKRAEKVEITETQVLYEYKLIGFSSIDDYFTIDENTGELRLKAFADMPPNASRAIESIQQDRIIKESADGKQMVVHDKIKIKLWKKTEALEMIARHTGGFVEKKEIDAKGEITVKHKLMQQYILIKEQLKKESINDSKNRIKEHLN